MVNDPQVCSQKMEPLRETFSSPMNNIKFWRLQKSMEKEMKLDLCHLLQDQRTNIGLVDCLNMRFITT